MGRKHSGILVAAVVGLALLAARPAQAESVFGLDLEYATLANEFSLDGFRGGQGLKLRGGYQLDLILLKLSVEAGAGYHMFGEKPGDTGASLLRGFAGARAAFGAIIQPSVYAQVGYGLLSLAGVEEGTPNRAQGLTYEGGLAFDFTLLPLLDVGAHAGYQFFQSLGDLPDAHLLVAGLHASLSF